MGFPEVHFEMAAKAFDQNANGDFGLGSDWDNKLSPITVFVGEINIMDVKGEGQGTYIKLESGVVRCYGPSDYGRLGNRLPMQCSLAFVDVLSPKGRLKAPLHLRMRPSPCLPLPGRRLCQPTSMVKKHYFPVLGLTSSPLRWLNAQTFSQSNHVASKVKLGVISLIRS